MKRINFFKKIYYSITGKKYKEMVEEKSGYAILYLAIFELVFTVIISVIAARNLLTASFEEVYDFAYNFLEDFIDNSLTLTFNTILVLSVLGYLYRLLTKNKVKYSKMFCLATYASTTAMILKYIVFMVNYITNMDIYYFNYVYVIIVIIYFVVNFKKTIENPQKDK